MLDNMSNVTRIKKILQTNAEKHLAMFKEIMKQNIRSEESKQEAREELMKYNKIKRILKNYGKN